MPPAPRSLKVAFIGAGGVNFGSPEGPWNHADRLERILGRELEVTAIVSPGSARRERVLSLKRASPAAASYARTTQYESVTQFLEDADAVEPDVVLIGVPPSRHGGTASGTDMEVLISARLPRAAIFVEKPMSSSSVAEVYEVGRRLDAQRALVSVGYFMRYLQAVQKMKQIIQEEGLTVMATVARYASCYSAIAKPDWWAKSSSCGPIVEQGTHFCDLSRYFGGDVEIASVQAHAVEHHEPPGRLSRVPVDEAAIAESDRIPRVTAAVWKYRSGAVGSLVHGINLQGLAFSCELEVHADGWLLRLVDPYHNPQLHVRSPANDRPEVLSFPGDDPFLTQMATLVDAASARPSQPDADRPASSSPILSSWEDAAKTYELTWAIRNSSEAWATKKKLYQMINQIE